MPTFDAFYHARANRLGSAQGVGRPRGPAARATGRHRGDGHPGAKDAATSLGNEASARPDATWPRISRPRRLRCWKPSTEASSRADGPLGRIVRRPRRWPRRATPVVIGSTRLWTPHELRWASRHRRREDQRHRPRLLWRASEPARHAAGEESRRRSPCRIWARKGHHPFVDVVRRFFQPKGDLCCHNST
jgi:hypothetical protein